MSSPVTLVDTGVLVALLNRKEQNQSPKRNPAEKKSYATRDAVVIMEVEINVLHE